MSTKNTHNNILHKLADFGSRFILLLSVVLFGLLAVGAFLKTAQVDSAYDIVIHLTWDNPLTNLLFAGVFLVLLYAVDKLFAGLPKKQNKAITVRSDRLLLILSILWVFGASLLWTYLSKSGPSSDCGSVFYAAKQFSQGDFSALSYRDSYFSVYPFQLGLAGFYELLFRLTGTTNFHLLQGVNAAFLSLMVLSMYRLTGLMFFRQEENSLRCRQTKRLLLILCDTCLPLIMYGSYVYGEIPSFGFLLFGSWMLFAFLKDCHGADCADCHGADCHGADCHGADNADCQIANRTRRVLQAVLALLSLTASVIVRKNTLIFLIALTIVLVLMLLRQKGTKPVVILYLILVLASASVSLPIVQSYYGSRTGTEINDGVPSSTYFAMGLMRAEAGPGHYNGYNFDTFTGADFDTETASEIGWQEFHNQLQLQLSHPMDFVCFLGEKFYDQWLNAGWAIFDSIYVSFGERLPVIESCFDGPMYHLLVSYFSGYQMMLYGFTFLGSLLLFGRMRRKEEVHPLSLLFLLTAVGGAIFYLAWEASGRYVLPYAILVLPNAALGAQFILEKWTKKVCGNSFFKKKTN